jgi:hypothetical protein
MKCKLMAVCPCYVSTKPATRKAMTFIFLSNKIIHRNTRVYPKVSGLGHNEINNNHSMRSNAKGYGSKTHQTDSQNNDTTASSGRELYHLQFSLQAASPETFGYTLVLSKN